MIPAPRFDYQAAATPGGIYQGLGALAEAATTAHAVRRKAQQDQAIAQQQAAQEQQKQAMGLARLRAENDHRARMFEGQQDLAERTATHQAAMLGVAKLRAENDQAFRMNPPAPQPKVATPMSPVDEEHRKAETAKIKRETELLGQPKAPPAPSPVSPVDIVKIEEARDAYVKDRVRAATREREAAAVVDYGFDKPVQPVTQAEIAAWRAEAEKRFPLHVGNPPAGGIGGLQTPPSTAGSAEELTDEELRALAGQGN